VPAVVLDTPQRAREGRARRRRMLKMLAVLAAAGIGAAAGRRTGPWERTTADYAAGVGEQRTIRLADGTVVTMNTDTALDVDQGSEERLIDLLRGEIHVAAGNGQGSMPRPFRVRTDFGTLRAWGTRFFVRLDALEARLIVQQGAVEVRTWSGASRTARAGETLRFNAGAVDRVMEDPLDQSSWMDGVLSVRDMPLGRFLSELGRYRKGIIACDHVVATLPVSGVYQTASTDKTLALVAASLNLSVSYRTRYWVTVGPRGADA